METKFDNVKNPSHYCEGRKYEPRKVIEDWGLGFYLGNALKYISRAGRKGPVEEDLKKAKQYIDFELERLCSETKNVETDICYANNKPVHTITVTREGELV